MNSANIADKKGKQGSTGESTESHGRSHDTIPLKRDWSILHGLQMETIMLSIPKSCPLLADSAFHADLLTENIV